MKAKARRIEKEDVLIAIDQLRGLITHPDADNLSYIRLTVRDGVRELFDSLGDSEALRHMRSLPGIWQGE